MKKISQLSLVLIVALAGSLSGFAVTFNVKVPPGTKKCYVCGAFNNWNADAAPELENRGDDIFTLSIDDVGTVSDGYKYLCGRSWDFVEKDSNGAEINNRTSLGNPDVVASWYHMPEYNIEKEEISINGIKRLIKVYLPEGYHDSQDAYPVIYYNTVQQRYNDAGSDTDAGDDFFAANSWNAQATMEKLRAVGGKAYIMVQVCSFLAENTPEENPDFVGTGNANSFLTAFVGELMPFIKSKYRVADGPDATTIVGADYGALFSLYAALMRPEVFANCVAMSPMLWINDGALSGIVPNATASQNYYLSVGGAEPDWMRQDLNALYQNLSSTSANVYFTEFPGAIHTDDAWGKSFAAILTALNSGSAPNATANSARRKATPEFQSTIYTLYAGTDQNNLQAVGPLKFADAYFAGKAQEAVPALVISQNIPESNKTKYYWNIAKGTDSSAPWLLDAPKNVSFSSKKNADSWLNIAVLEDGSTYNVAAHCNGFSVVNGTDKTPMSHNEDFVCTATVAFPSGNKSFNIHYGSVNSASDMGALTRTYSVSDACTEALITYDFTLNTVSIIETARGVTEPEIEFKDRTYSLFGGLTQGSLSKVGNLVYTQDYRRKGSDTPVDAFVITAVIDASVKANYYYNIAKDDDSSAGWLLTADNTIGFKSSKTENSWLSVAVLEDGTVASTAAHSKGFRVVTAAGDVPMQQSQGFSSTATVNFPGSDKAFQINFGSVNTASDMGAMTPQMAVSENCIEAIISYDFNLNKLTVTETKFGQSLDDLAITSFTATPSVCNAGSPVALNLVLSDICDVAITCRHNNTEEIAITPQQSSPTSYSIFLENTTEGIYTFTVALSLGDNTDSNAAEINVRVLPEGAHSAKNLSVNPYENIDWQNVGRYKANFHTHTSQSFDTQYTTTQVVDKYKDAGYKILALTDHDANSYPWDKFSLYNPAAADRNPESIGMLAIPGIELSKDRRNNWSESTGGEFNHHNDFFTGRKGQEFMSLRESYAYTQAIGGLQIINHPGQYWNIATKYNAGAKNSPEWHAENFRLYKSLVGLEVYNQGNRRPNDRILWDQILTINMPDRPVWGYSCDDTHTAEQYFRNYQFMLMDNLDTDNLKEAMKNGCTVFSYEHTGSGQDLAPHVKAISVDNENHTITIDSDDADKIEWISATHRTNTASPSSTKSTVVGIGKSFPFKDFQGSYVRARLTNSKGETATQPFGFSDLSNQTTIINDFDAKDSKINVVYHKHSRSLAVNSTEPICRISIINMAGAIIRYIEYNNENTVNIPCRELANGAYLIVVATNHAAYTAKFSTL